MKLFSYMVKTDAVRVVKIGRLGENDKRNNV